MATKYYVDDELVEEDEFWSTLENDVCDECEYNFDEYLDECEDEVKVFGFSFSASQVLYEMDYTAYRSMLCDYQSDTLDDKKDEVERYGYVGVNGSSFRIEEEDEEEEEENDA